jgi:cytochrome c oxidase subunit 4
MMSSQSPGHAIHITPLRVYLGIGAALLVLTAVTVWVSTIHLGPWNIVVALAIAAIKATLVAFFFMHLFYDNKFYFLVFTVGVLFLALFIGFTMIDTMRRGDLYEELAKPIRDRAMMYDSLPDSTAAAHGAHGTGSMPAQADSSAASDSGH